jgi:hypothetical protein
VIEDQRIPASPDSEVVSPELALVDPVLAAHARTLLPDPDDTLARIQELVQASRRTALARESEELSGRRGPIPVVSSPSAPSAGRFPRRSQWRSAVLAGVAAAATLTIALLLGVRVDVRGSQADADSTAIDEVPATTTSPAAAPESKPKAQHTKPTTRSKSTKSTKSTNAAKPSTRSGQRPRLEPISRRFAWAPSADASGYHVELFRGSSKVFAVNTKSPSVTIPARWTFASRTRQLAPGDYRWYVWPMVSGRTAAAAIVQAKLVVPPR